MEPSLFRYIWKHSKRQQLLLIALILCSIPTYFIALDLPKQIVNGPITGDMYNDPESTVRFFNWAFSWPFWGSDQTTITLLDGVELTRLQALFALSLSFLGFVIVNGLFKYVINTHKGILGERMLRRLRYELVDRLLRFPIKRYRSLRGSEVASMVKDEVEPLGVFIGDSIALPLFQLAQALTALSFIMMQNAYLGMIAVATILVTTVIIPILRRRLLILAKKRQLAARQLAGRVGELVDGVLEIRTNDTSNYERADIINRLGEIFFIRFDIYRWKFFVKFLNNLLAQVTPFFFYLIGGYFAIRGELDIGQLVAVIAAYKDLPPPIKEIINWDHKRLDVQAKYGQVIEQFHEDSLIAEDQQKIVKEPPASLSGDVELTRVFVESEGGASLQPLTMSFGLNERVAVLGNSGSGMETFVDAMAGVVVPNEGSIRIGGHDLDMMPDHIRGRRLAYLHPNPFFSQPTLETAFSYGLCHLPQSDSTVKQREMDGKQSVQRLQREARESGQPYFNAGADWTNYQALGVRGRDEMVMILCNLLGDVQLERDVYRFGLSSKLGQHDEATERKIIRLRGAFRQEINKRDLRHLVEMFRPNSFHTQSTVLQNIIFGAIIDEDQFNGSLERDTAFLSLLKANGSDRRLFELGVAIADTLTTLFEGLSTNLDLLDRLGFVDEEQLLRLEELIRLPSEQDWDKASDDAKADFLSLAFSYCEPRHRFGLMSETLQAHIVEIRINLRKRSSVKFRSAIRFFNPNRYDHTNTIGGNLIFGRVNSAEAEARNVVDQVLFDLLGAEGFVHDLMQIGLQMNMGSGAKNFTLAQRQKIAVARALLKQPDLLVVNKALSGMDQETVTKIMQAVLAKHEGGIVWAMSQRSNAEGFDRILVFDDGRLIENTVLSSVQVKAG